MGFVQGASANAASGDTRHSNRVPSNPRLWKLIVLQARMKYKTYPNPAASHWVHDQYVNHGGQFVEHNESTRRKKLMKRKHEQEQHRRTAKSEKTKAMEKGGKHEEDKKD
jgi:hypothetical protein